MPSRNLLLRSLGLALEHIAPRLTPVSLAVGQVIHQPGRRIDRVWFPVSGLISARTLLESGHELECVLIGRTNALGALAAVGQSAALTHDVCIVPGQAWTLSLPDLEWAIRTIPGVDAQFRQFAYGQMAYALRSGVCNAMHGAEQRIARWLLLAATLTERIEVRLGQEELAHILGLQRSAVNPTLQRLKSDGLLEVSRGRIAIRDRAGLKRRACECETPLGRSIGACA